jgi:hypothetical protein
MQRFLVIRRPPSAVERLIGRRRTRRLPRRAGLAALGAGIVLLRPKRFVPLCAATCALVVVAVSLAAMR